MSNKLDKLKKLQKWEKRRLFLTLFLYCGIMGAYLIVTCGYLYHDNVIQPAKWEHSVNDNKELIPEVTETGKKMGAAEVMCGTYLENIKKIDFKNNSFDGVMVVWFKWNGHNDLDMIHNFRLYKGDITRTDIMYDYHEGDVNYQKARINFSITKNYVTPRFPLGSYQLHIYIEPNMRCDEVLLTPDYTNSSINSNLEVSGYDVTRHAVALVPIEYQNTQSDPQLEKIAAKDGKIMTTEMMTAIEITRDGIGTYLKCFIALFATTTWVLITLYLCTVHEVDPLGMVPAAFFGSVSNIMVGANLLPDALQPGLIEYVNIWGIMNILACTMMIISINSIRRRYHENEFAKGYGRIMFITATCTAALGNILLPLVCII